MIAITTRHKLMAGALLLVGAFWILDMTSTKPRSASAQPAADAVATATPPEAPSTEPQELAEILLGGRPDPAPPAAPSRDLFALPPAMQKKKPPPEPAAVVAAESAEKASKQADLKYVLQGVITGPNPLAVIDGRPYAPGARLDEWRIERIERDRVLLRSGLRRVWLQMGNGP